MHVRCYPLRLAWSPRGDRGRPAFVGLY